jgi:hypothetical protein
MILVASSAALRTRGREFEIESNRRDNDDLLNVAE